MIVIGLLCFFIGFVFGLLLTRTEAKKDQWVPMGGKARNSSSKQATIVDLQDPLEKVQL